MSSAEFENEPNEEFRDWMTKTVFSDKYRYYRADLEKVVKECDFVYSREAAYAIMHGVSLKDYIQRLSTGDIEVLTATLLSPDEACIHYKHNYVFTLLGFEDYGMTALGASTEDALKERVDHLISALVILRTEKLRRLGLINEDDVQYTFFPVKEKIEVIMNKFDSFDETVEVKEQPVKKVRKPRKKPLNNQ